jgi:hypothetical protein
MKISLTSISIGDRVQAAKTSPNATDTSGIPTTINPSPGDSTISPIDTSGIDAAGANVNQQTQQGNKATSDSARKSNNPANQGLQYDRSKVSSNDQAPAAAKTTDIATTPEPKSKGFKESLIGAQLGSKLGNNTGGDRGTIDSDFGHNNNNPSQYIHNQPEGEPIRRDRLAPYDNSNNNVPEPNKPPITTFDKTNNMSPYKAPERDLGPAYKRPPVHGPSIKFNSPKIGTPKFK